jgi:putative oxidoreductase
MASFGEVERVWSPRLLSVLRIAVSFLFMPHGAQKLFGVLDGKQVELLSLMGLAGVLELFGGLLVFVGLLTQPVAFLLSGQMAAAYFMVHAPQGFSPVLNKGELAALYCFVFLYLAVAGPGPWSVDRLRSRA